MAQSQVTSEISPTTAESVDQLAEGLVRPRLLFVALSLDIGGAERHLSSVLPELARRGWPVTIYCTNRLGAFADDVRAAGVEVIGPPHERRAGQQALASRLSSTARAGARLFKLMRGLKPAVAHFFLPEAYLIGAPSALLLRIPVCVMSRRGLNYYQSHWPGAAAIERRLHPRMTAVLANSRRVAADLAEEGCDPSRIGLIYNGVAIVGLDAPLDRGLARRRLGIEATGPVAVVVANLIHYKGHADLLRALSHVRARLPDGMQVLCIGRDEGARAALESLRVELELGGMVSFLGVRNDVPDLLAAADISILPSHEEGFSNAVIEAMAAGLPLVVTDVGGNPEAVVNGETGLVVPPKAPEALGDAIAQLAGDAALCRRFGEAGRARALQRFTLSACVDHYEQLYLGLVAGRSLAEIGLEADRA